jgi:hypothetical protein
MEATDAIEAVAFAALTAGVTLAPVYQHVPEDTPPPVVIVADIDEDAEPLSSKDGAGDMQARLRVVTVFQGHERKPLTAISGQVRQALDGLRQTIDQWDLTFVFTGRDGSMLEDGETYVGNNNFTVFALRAA